MSDARFAAAQAARGARALSVAGAELAAQRHGAGAAIAAASAGRPWGGDPGGQAFDLRYSTVERQVLDAWEQLADYIESLGEAAARSVRDHVDVEAAPVSAPVSASVPAPVSASVPAPVSASGPSWPVSAHVTAPVSASGPWPVPMPGDRQ
jgi:hypothetical protein